MNTVNDTALRYKTVTLAELLDRVLDKGVTVDGDIYLSVAGIELIYLKLKLLLASTATVEKYTPPEYREGVRPFSPCPRAADVQCAGLNPQEEPGAVTARVLRDDEPAPSFDKRPSERVNIDPKKVEKGLAKLVLTLVELLRELMEKQALRRVELGQLKENEIDNLGEAFMRLDEKMKELKKVFGLKDEDLNLDLGPVGDLI